ncbi:hypothetical protein MSG28_015288 [Choristoneura fumiferana]|uniref:Uncharacterized protein n=1 Tax=Choristoneura fumiferana TaxID=7141 RepID=A0ACC0K9M6_CHOFU|nr:hypothetical protein MSG28_015288 [Choristoneura fumiferana]
MALDFVCVRVKKEQDWDGVSEAAVSAGLYAGHEIKEEMVLGPEVLQPSDVAFMLRSQDRDKTPDFSPGTAAPEPLAAPRHPGPGSKGAPVKRERDEELPMVRIHSPYGFDGEMVFRTIS